MDGGGKGDILRGSEDASWSHCQGRALSWLGDGHPCLGKKEGSGDRRKGHLPGVPKVSVKEQESRRSRSNRGSAQAMLAATPNLPHPSAGCRDCAEASGVVLRSHHTCSTVWGSRAVLEGGSPVR